ncbi:MAG TPA: hypothetical protein DEO73_02260, partial [Pantoea sp.]|nr:hypothetical protein [Pantoea sp.]
MEESKKSNVHRSSHENATVSVLTDAPAAAINHAADSAVGQISTTNAALAEAKPVQVSYVADDEHAKQVIADGITYDATPRFVGTAEPYTPIIIYDGENQIGVTTSDENGNWTFTPASPLEVGARNLTFSSDKSSDSFNFVLLAEGTTVISLDYQIDDSGERNNTIVPGDKIQDTTPRFAGTADPNTTITVYDNGQPIAVITSEDNGNWSFFPTLGTGAHSLTFDAGNGNTTKPFTFEIVGTAEPEVPVIVEPETPIVVDPEIPGIREPGAPVRISFVVDDERSKQIVEGSKSYDSTPRLIGDAAPNTLVTIFDGEKMVGSTMSDDKGFWSFTVKPALDAGSHHLIVTTPGSSVSFDFVVLPVGTTPITLTPPVDDSGEHNSYIAPGDKIHDTTPRFAGRADPGAVITVYDNGKPIAEITAEANGNWYFFPEMGVGEHNLIFDAGNGNTTQPFNFEIVGPETVATTIDYGIDDSRGYENYLNRGDTTNDTTPLLRGHAAPNVEVTIFDNGKPVGTAMANSRGEWEFTAELSDGSHNITAKASTGNESDTFSFTIVDPQGVQINIGNAYDDTHGYELDIERNGITNDTTPRFTGSAGPNAKITVYDNGQPIGTVDANDMGYWTYTADLSSGAHSITFEAGKGSLSDAFNFTVVTPESQPITVDHAYDDTRGYEREFDRNATTNDTTPRFTGRAGPNVKITVYDNGHPVGETVADSAGYWTYTAKLGAGAHSIAFEAGKGSLSDAFSFTVTAPESQPITIEAVNQDINYGWEPIGENGTTRDTTPRFNGKASPNVQITVYDNGQPIGVTT